MVNYNSLEEMMNTTEHMEVLINGSGQDDNVLTITGAEWFVFKGVPAKNIYVSGNSFIGFGENASHLLICNRDGKLWYLYREEAMLYDSLKVLKLRWEGYTRYNKTSSSYTLNYELFLFENGDIFLNIIQAPGSSSYLGTSQLNANSTYAYSVAVTKQQSVSFYHLDDIGGTYEVKYEQMAVPVPYERRYLLSDKEGIYYRTYHEKAFVDAIEYKGLQYIQTGVIPTEDTKIEIAFRCNHTDSRPLFGIKTADGTPQYALAINNMTEVSVMYGTESMAVAVEDMTDTSVVLELSKEGLKRDGVVLAEFAETEFTALYDICIGAVSLDGVVEDNYFLGKLYSVSIWQGEELALHLVPCVDETLVPCLYDSILQSCYYNAGIKEFGYEDTKGAYDEATVLEPLEVMELTADVFEEFGSSDVPRGSVMTRLRNPVFWYWHDSDTDPPVLLAELTAIPPRQTVYSQNTEMTDSSILGIEKVEIDSDDTTLFAFSFDAGETWLAYVDNTWAALSEETSGMNRGTVESIGTDAWEIAKETNQYMVRFTLAEDSFVNRITIYYLN